VRAGPQQPIGQPGAGLGEVLAVVQHQQHLAPADVLDQPLGRRGAGPVDQAERRGDRPRHQRPFGQGGQLDPPHAVLEVARRAHPLGHRQRQARLAGPADAGERDQPAGGQQLLDLRHLALAADEARQRQRQAAAAGPFRDRRRLVDRTVRHALLPPAGQIIGRRRPCCQGPAPPVKRVWWPSC
jgi:hypothetical protein